MNIKTPWQYVPPLGPVLSLFLIGLVMLSAVLYYRAVKIQRFLEPALAISQPPNEFAKSISQRFEKEYGAKSKPGLKVKPSSILMEKSLLFSKDGTLKASAKTDLQKIARIFLSLMDDADTRSDISLVLIISRFPSYGARGVNFVEQMKAQQLVGALQNALFQLEPRLGIRYSNYFAGAARPTTPHEGNRDVVEFRIIPSEFLHIQVLEKLEKYSL